MVDLNFKNKQEFQPSFEEIGKLVKKTEKVCAIHETPLLELKGRTVCPNCQRQKLEKWEQERVEVAMKNHHKRRTQGRLHNDSILGDLTLKQATFDSFVADDEEAIANKEKALKIARLYLKGEVFNSLLTGKAGTGKSHLAKAMLEAVNEHSRPYKSCLFISLSDFVLEIRNTFGNNDRNNHDTEQSMIERIADVDLLVLDDLGAETGFIGTDKTASDFTQRVLYSLMNKRQDKSTIITTNLDSSQLSNMYDSKILSRLYRNLEGNIIKFENSKDRRMTF